MIYTYDAAGNLVSARNLVAGQSSRYGYQSGPVAPADRGGLAVERDQRRHPVRADASQVLPLDGRPRQLGPVPGLEPDRHAGRGGDESLHVQPAALGAARDGLRARSTWASRSRRRRAARSSRRVPAIAGPDAAGDPHRAPTSAFALYAISQAGLELLDALRGQRRDCGRLHAAPVRRRRCQRRRHGRRQRRPAPGRGDGDVGGPARLSRPRPTPTRTA